MHGAKQSSERKAPLIFPKNSGGRNVRKARGRERKGAPSGRSLQLRLTCCTSTSPPSRGPVSNDGEIPASLPLNLRTGGFLSSLAARRERARHNLNRRRSSLGQTCATSQPRGGRARANRKAPPSPAGDGCPKRGRCTRGTATAFRVLPNRFPGCVDGASTSGSLCEDDAPASSTGLRRRVGLGLQLPPRKSAQVRGPRSLCGKRKRRRESLSPLGGEPTHCRRDTDALTRRNRRVEEGRRSQVAGGMHISRGERARAAKPAPRVLLRRERRSRQSCTRVQRIRVAVERARGSSARRKYVTAQPD